VKIPAGVLAYLKYSRATLPWVLIFASIVLPLAMMVRRAPLARAAARRGIDSRSLSLQEARSLIAPVNSSPSAARPVRAARQLVVADRLVHHARGQRVLRALAARGRVDDPVAPFRFSSNGRCRRGS